MMMENGENGGAWRRQPRCVIREKASHVDLVRFFLLHAGFAVVNQAPEQHPGLDNDDDNGNAPPTRIPSWVLTLWSKHPRRSSLNCLSQLLFVSHSDLSFILDFV
jgi:hypothetical protein